MGPTQTTQTASDSKIETEKDKSSDGVRAVGRALDILLAFSASDYELTANEILKRVDLSRPTLYRLLYTLEQSGFVTASGAPQRFRLGPAVARLSWAWSGSLDIAHVAQPVMLAVWQETRETVALFVPQGELRLCIAEMPSPQPLSFKRGVGYSERIVRGASGRAILAWAQPSVETLALLCHGLVTAPDELLKELAAIRHCGYAVSRNELIQGAIAIAVPFFDQGGRVAGAIGVFGPDVRMNIERTDAMAPQLMAHALELSRALGYTRAKSL